MKYRKKPVVIEAKQFNGDNWAEIISWVHQGLHPASQSIIVRAADNVLAVRTLEDRSGQFSHYATQGDWIIKGVKGEFYPCKPDIFEATYEPAE